MNNYRALKGLRRCQPCQLGEHERCQRTTTLGTLQHVDGVDVDVCGCACPQATAHREGVVTATKRKGKKS
jgi:hypothetical protein